MFTEHVRQAHQATTRTPGWRPRCVAALIAVLQLCRASGAAAQASEHTARLAGVVINAATGQPVANADVRVIGTVLVARTSDDGRFAIANAPVGVFTVEARATGVGDAVADHVRLARDRESTLRLVLSTGPARLSGLVTSATAQPVSPQLTGFSVDKVTADEFPVPSALSAVATLEGKVAGLSVVRENGSPGSDLFVALRTPISLNDSMRPLYVVDGVMLNAQYPMSAQDIEALDVASIEVIKGVSAATIYGFRGINGVIAITTRRGNDLAIGKTQVSVRNEVGNDYSLGVIQSPAAHAFRVNALGQYVDVNGNVVTRDKRVLQANGIVENAYIDPTYDHNDQLFRAGLFNTQTVSLQQNRAATNFNVQYSRSQQRGTVVDADGLLRQSARLSLDQRWGDRLQVGLSASHTWSDEDKAADRFTDLALFNADVNLRQPSTGGPSPYRFTPDPSDASLVNPLANQFLNSIVARRQRTLIGAHGSYRVLPWLSLTANGSYDRAYQTETNTYDILDNATTTIPMFEDYRIRRDSVAFGELRGGAIVTKSAGDLVTRLTVLGETQRDAFQASDSQSTRQLYPAAPGLPSSSSEQHLQTDRHVLAALAGLDIEYADKYEAEVMYRRDGNTSTASHRNWTPFVRGSAAWSLNKETWLPFAGLDLLKLRYSVGTAETPTVQYASLDIPFTTFPSNPLTANPTTVSEREVGLDIALSSRLQATLAYASTHSSVAALSSTSTAAGNYYFYNVGIKGHSAEGTVHVRALNNFHGLQWDLSFAGDRRRATISQLDAPCRYINNIQLLCPGTRLGVLSGLRFLRDKSKLDPQLVSSASTFDVNDEGYVVPVGPGNSWRDGKAKALWGTQVIVNGQSLPWGLPVIERDSNGATTYAPIVDANPKLQYGFQNSVRYHGVRVYGQLTGQIGGQIYNDAKRVLYRFGDHPDVNQIGKPDDLRKPLGYYRTLGQFSTTLVDRFVESAAYARLSEFSVGYVLNARSLGFLKHIGAQEVAIDLVGRDLFTFSGYTGSNPQAFTLNTPIEYIAYPLSRTFTLATSIVF